MTQTALFVGRFQPFHKGHKKSICSILNETDEIVVAVGSADSSHTEKNPFTAGERIRMIRQNFNNMHSCVYTVPIVDIERNAIWTSHVQSFCPSFDEVYTNNNLVSRLFEEEGYQVRNHHMYDRDKYSGTDIRSRIVNGEEWENLVPSETAQVISDIDGVSRIRAVSRDE